MGEGAAVEFVAVQPPLGHELVHKGFEAVVVAALEQMHQFMPHHVLEAVWWIGRAEGAVASPSGTSLATGATCRNASKARSMMG